MDKVTFKSINKNFYNFLNSNLDYDGVINICLPFGKTHKIDFSKIWSRKKLHLFFEQYSIDNVTGLVLEPAIRPMIDNIIIGIERCLHPSIDSLLDECVNSNCIEIYGMKDTIRIDLCKSLSLTNISINMDKRNNLNAIPINHFLENLNLKKFVIKQDDNDNLDCKIDTYSYKKNTAISILRKK
jgi:hypothetical protein